ETVSRAERAGHAPTIAAARYVLDAHYAWLTHYDTSPARLDAWIESQRKAAAGWPEGGMDGALASTLARVGMLRAATESPVIGKAVEADGRVYGMTMLVYRLLRG